MDPSQPLPTSGADGFVWLCVRLQGLHSQLSHLNPNKKRWSAESQRELERSGSGAAAVSAWRVASARIDPMVTKAHLPPRAHLPGGQGWE